MRWGLLAALAALGLTWLLYHPALDYGFVNYDDPHFVRDNPALAGGLTWESIQWAWTANLITPDRQVEYWMPITQLSRLLDFQLFGADGGGHHLQSLLGHALNGWLVFLLFLHATGAGARSAAVALLWLLHPLNVETVAWVALRKDVLAGTFALLTLLAWAHYARRPRRLPYLLALLAFIGAILCKPSVAALPAVMLVLDWWPVRRTEWANLGRGWMQLLAEKIPFLLLAAAIGWLTHANHRDLVMGGGRYDYSWFDRIRQMLAGYSGYVERAIFPNQLCILYPARPPEEIPQLDVAQGVVLLVCLTALTGWLAWRGHRAAAAGWLWFVALLLPVSGLVQFGRQALADRYAYMALVGFLAALVWLAADTIKALTARRRWKQACWAGGALAVLALALAWKSRGQLETWRNDYTLWGRVFETERDCITAFTNYGTALNADGLYRVAGTYLTAGHKVDPENVEQIGHLGVYHAAYGDAAHGARLLDTALRNRPLNIRYHTWFIHSLARLGRIADARFATARLEAIRGRKFLRTGLDLLASGYPEAAREQFAQAFSACLGLRRNRPGQPAEFLPAADWTPVLRDALASQPVSADMRALLEGYGAFLRSQAAESAEIFQGVAERQPTWAEPRWRRATCLALLGNKEEAAREAAAAATCTQADPDGAADWQLARDVLPPVLTTKPSFSPE